MESKYPKVEPDFLRVGRLPYFALYEVVEFLFGLEIDFLKTRGGWVDQYHILASKTHWELMDWILRDMKVGRLKEIPGADPKNTCFAASEIGKWLIGRKVIQWLVKQGIQVPVETMKFFNFEPPVRPSDNQNNKTAHPAPTTKKAQRIALKSKTHAIYKKLQGRRSQFTYKDILVHPDWSYALKDAGYDEDYQLPIRTLQNWLSDFRKADDLTSH